MTTKIKTKEKNISVTTRKASGLIHIVFSLMRLNIDYLTEYKFSKNRKFRFDIAIPQHKIAVEYEGIYSAKSRHTTLRGYTDDTEKYNLAVIEGWSVIRYTAKNYKNFNNDIEQLIQSKTKNNL